MTTAATAAPRPRADGGAAGSLYLGLDSSTQSLSAVVLEARGREHRVVLEFSLPFDVTLPQYGTRHGVLPREDPAVACSSPLMWVEALDLALARAVSSGLDIQRLRAISGSAQQHGSVYLNADAQRGLGAFDATHPPARQLAPLLARPVAPIWMDSSTSAECLAIEAAVGGPGVLARHTGSRAFERFTGPQIRKFATREPEAYARTDRIHLVSSFLASVLIGAHAPLDPGDGSGMNLMELHSREWWQPALTATASGLASRLPAIAPSASVAGTLSAFWRARHGLPPARVVTWSGDNPSSLIGAGLVREGNIGISLGTSDTLFGPMASPRVDEGGTGHVFGSPTGDFMGITVFSNGSLARERMRDAFGLSWDGFSRALESTPPGNNGGLLLPWFEREITPPVRTPGVHRSGLEERAVGANVRGVVEAQMMALARHSRWMGMAVRTIHVTGGASANRAILQVMADVFGAEVLRFERTNAAALGAALRALHADRLGDDRPLSWTDVVSGLEQHAPLRVHPVPAHHEVYRLLLPRYDEFERRVLARWD
jgi:xylulokinase